MKVYLIKRLKDDRYYGGHYWSWYTSPAHAKMYKNGGNVKLGLYNIGNKRWNETKEQFVERMSHEYKVLEWDLGEPNFQTIPSVIDWWGNK